MTVLLVAVGGAAGAVLRYLIDRRVQGRGGSDFPFGTLTVNVLGSLVLGVLTGIALHSDGTAPPEGVRALVAVGLCGSLTTFSTFGYETVRMFSERARLHASMNVLVTVVAGFLAAGAGILISSAF